MTKKKNNHKNGRYIGSQMSFLSNMYEEYDAAICKLFRHHGLDAALYTTMTRYQKDALRINVYDPPTVIREKGHDVPRHILRQIRANLFSELKFYHMGDEEINLSYWEMAIYCLSFLSSIKKLSEFWLKNDCAQIRENTRLILDKLHVDDIYHKNGLAFIFQMIDLILTRYSQVNYRYYGYSFDWEIRTDPISKQQNARMLFSITSTKCKFRYFTHQNKSRLAYEILMSKSAVREYSTAECKRKLIFPDDQSDESYKLFIQPHAIHRLKQRFDITDPSNRNYILKLSICYEHLFASLGSQRFFCYNLNGALMGYFPFFIENDNLVIKTFLPFISNETPVGNRFHAVMPLSKEELSYLGMDKMSFYTSVDFDQIPLLKNVFIDTGVWEVIKGIEKNIIDPKSERIDQERTLFVKHFFDKHACYYGNTHPAQIPNRTNTDDVPMETENTALN